MIQFVYIEIDPFLSWRLSSFKNLLDQLTWLLILLFTVHEKEKLRGRDPDKEDEEGGFGEYTRT